MSKPCAARCKNWCFLLIQRSNLKPLKLSKTSKVWWRHEPEGSPHSRSKSKEDRCGSRCGTAPQRDCWRIRPKRPPLFSCSRPSGTSAPHMRWSTSSKDRGPFNIFRASCAKNVWLNPYVVYIYIYITFVRSCLRFMRPQCELTHHGCWRRPYANLMHRSAFSHNHTPKKKLTRRPPLQVKLQPYGKLTQHACLTTPLRNLMLFGYFCLRPSSIWPGLYLVHLGRFLAVLK